MATQQSRPLASHLWCLGNTATEGSISLLSQVTVSVRPAQGSQGWVGLCWKIKLPPRFPPSHAALTSTFPDISRASMMSSLSCVLSALHGHGQLTWRTCFLSVEGPLFPHHKKEGENPWPNMQGKWEERPAPPWLEPSLPHPTPSHPISPQPHS